MERIGDLLNHPEDDHTPTRNYRNPLINTEAKCEKCFDKGVSLKNGVPVICDCPAGQSEEGHKYYREIMLNKKRETEKIKLEQTRIMPNIVIKPGCEICNDVKFVINKDGQTVPCVCQKEARQKARNAVYLKLCNLPEKRPEWNLDAFIARPGSETLLESARAMVSGEIKWLTILAERGYGKTHILVGICREFLKQGKSARYVLVPDLMGELKQGFDEKGLNSYQAKMDFFKNVTLLGLDDLGTENTSSWVREQLDVIVDYRYVNKKPLVVTTNKALDEIMPRVASRLTRIELDGIGRRVVPKGVNYYDYVKRDKK